VTGSPGSTGRSADAAIPGAGSFAGIDAARRARVYLLRVAEPPAPALARLVAEHGPVVAARLVGERRVTQDVAAETESRCGVNRVDADLAAARAHGARLVIPEDDEWPRWPFAAFDQAAARGVPGAVAPLALWVCGPGRLDELSERAAAIVGARAATAYGEHVACELGYGLADRGWTVVSGAAYGIDGAAHRGALAAEGDTVAVMACGVDVPYPSGHAALLGRVAEQGAVISEYPPGTPPARHRFLFRNRLIAALGQGTVVVEAGVRSGASNTASTTAALGRVVMAVPGPVTSAQSVGCHELLRSQRAVLVGGIEDVMESIGRIGTDLATVKDRPVHPTDGLDQSELRVHEALRPRAGRTADWLARDSGVPIARVRAALPMLEQRGLAERCESGWRRSRAPRPRGGA
jgi:DNA processing protein